MADLAVVSVFNSVHGHLGRPYTQLERCHHVIKSCMQIFVFELSMTGTEALLNSTLDDRCASS